MSVSASKILNNFMASIYLSVPYAHHAPPAPPLPKPDVDNYNMGYTAGTVPENVAPNCYEPITRSRDADRSGHQAADDALQECMNHLSEDGVLEIPAGNYLLQNGLEVSNPITIKTSGVELGDPWTCLENSLNCAVLRAGSSLSSPGGVLNINGKSDVTLNHIAIDGNRSFRIASEANNFCLQGNNKYGQNIRANNTLNFKMQWSTSSNALCGTALEMHRAIFAVIEHNVFSSNGQHSWRQWADGLTGGNLDGAKIQFNVFRDNSDIDLIFSGKNSLVARNKIYHSQDSERSFAAIMVDNWRSAEAMDMSGTILENNIVNCGQARCNYGIQVGPAAWYPTENWVKNFTIRSNQIEGAIVALNIGDASDLLVEGNKLSWYPSAIKMCGHVPPRFNITPDRSARLVIRDQVGPDGTLPFSPCPGP